MTLVFGLPVLGVLTATYWIRHRRGAGSSSSGVA
jgi:hypothetical protein